MTAAEPVLGTARELRAKAALYADSARKLLDERQVIDARKDKADAKMLTVPEESRDAYKADVLKTWWAEHAQAEEDHAARLHGGNLTTATAVEA